MYNKEYFKNGILGSKETVELIKSKDVKNYVKKYFVKNNCTIAICSPLSFNKVKSIISKYFESVMPSNNLKPLPHRNLKLSSESKVSLYHKDIDKNFLSVTFMLPRKGPNLKYRTYLGSMCNIIDDISDGLTKELRIDNGLIYAMEAEYFINRENSYIELETEVCKENIKPCLDVMFNYIKKLRENGFTKQDLTKELEKDEYYWQTRVISPDNIKNNLTKYRFYDRFINNEEVHKYAQSIKLDELNNAMRELFDSAKINVFVYGNATKQDVYTIKQIEKKFK